MRLGKDSEQTEFELSLEDEENCKAENRKEGALHMECCRQI